MKYLPTLSLLLFFLSCSNAEGKEINKNISDQSITYPNIEEVVNHLQQNLPVGCNNCYFELIKNAEGYFLQVIQQKENSEIEVLEKHLVWNAVTQDFIDFSISEDNKNPKIKSDFRSILYAGKSNSANLFYGYDNANIDVINKLENKEVKSNKELEQLARAYDNLACSYIHPKWNTKNTSTLSLKGTNFQKVSEDRIANFINYADKSLNAYKQIIASNPEYATPVGTVTLKHANLCMHFYNNLISVREEAKAKKYLEMVDFPDVNIKVAKTYLDLCSQNAILFTAGDNDSFPLWYLQLIENYRTDVLVLNESFLNADYYITLNEEVKNLKTTISGNELFLSELAYVVLDASNKSSNDFSIFLKDVKSKLASTKIGRLDFYNYGTSFSIPFQETLIQIDFQAPYLTSQEITLFDIIMTNTTRPIFFTSNSWNKFGLNKYMRQRSIIKELVSEKGSSIDSLSLSLVEKEIEALDLGNIKKLGNMSTMVCAPIFYAMMEIDESSEKRIELFNKIIEKLPLEDLITEDLITVAQFVILSKPSDSDKYTYPENVINEKMIVLVDKMKIDKDNASEQISKLNTIANILQISNPEYKNNRDKLNSNPLCISIVNKLDKLVQEEWFSNLPFSNSSALALKTKLK